VENPPVEAFAPASELQAYSRFIFPSAWNAREFCRRHGGTQAGRAAIDDAVDGLWVSPTSCCGTRGPRRRLPHCDRL